MGVGLLVGRFQPLHNGHVELLRHVRRQFRPSAVLWVIGSAEVSHTVHDPFTAGERFEMSVRMAKAERIEDLWPIPVPDVHRHAIWVSYLESMLPPFSEVYTSDPLSRVLFEEAGYTVPKLPFFRRELFQGTELRRRMIAGEPWEEGVPPAVVRYLEEIQGVERLRLLAGSAEATKGSGREHEPEGPGPTGH